MPDRWKKKTAAGPDRGRAILTQDFSRVDQKKKGPKSTDTGNLSRIVNKLAGSGSCGTGNTNRGTSRPENRAIRRFQRLARRRPLAARRLEAVGFGQLNCKGVLWSGGVY